MKVETTAKRSILGKRQSGFISNFAGWSAEGDTRESSEDSLWRKIHGQSDKLFARRYVRANGATFCLFYADGWNYDLVRDDGAQQPSTCGLTCRSYAEALEQMLSHVRQFSEGITLPPEIVAGNGILRP